MWTTLKNWWKGYKFIKLSNGKWICFVRKQGLWQALANEGYERMWHMPTHIAEYCQFPNEEAAVLAFAKFSNPPPNIQQEIREHQ